MQNKNISSRELHKYVLGLVSVWILFVMSFPVAYLRVSRSEKYHGIPFKSLTWEQTQHELSKMNHYISTEVKANPVEKSVSEPVNETSKLKKITDAVKINQLNQQVYDRIDILWNTWPNFTENLVYQVTVNTEGVITDYKSINKAADIYLSETPLSSLIQPELNSAEAVTNFTVIFTHDGVLEVTPSSFD